MKNIAKICPTFIICTIFVFILASCGTKVPAVEIVKSDETVVAFKANEDGGSLEEALNVLMDSGEFDYSGKTGEYGLYIESVNGRAADTSQNEYWAVYTSLGELDGVMYSSSEYGTYDLDGTVLNSASYGVSGLPLVEGEYYVIVLETY